MTPELLAKRRAERLGRELAAVAAENPLVKRAIRAIARLSLWIDARRAR